MGAGKWFDGRRLLIATKHGKEAVIAPALESTLGVRCFVPDDYDTDQFGTFTGEVPRTLGPLETARRKCEVAINRYGAELAVASEGSFGAHPLIGFVPCDDELLVLIDRRHGFEIVERELSLQTNIGSATIADEAELTQFARQCGFPEHGLILSVPGMGAVRKGIAAPRDLVRTFRAYRQLGAVKAETDMRALFNPTRMQVIGQAAAKLARRAASLCPDCGLPGYGPSEVIPGLPCGLCGRPTRSALACEHACSGCGRTSRVARTDKKEEDAAFCDYCNP